MFLRRLELENIRSIEKLDISFVAPKTDPSEPDTTRKWTLLLGENGTGKSTVLKAIALVLAGSDALPKLLGDPDAWIRRGRQEARIHVDLVTADGEKRAAELKLVRGKKVRDTFDLNKESLDQLDNAIAHSARSYLTIGYGVNRRLSERSTLGSSPPTESTSHPRAQRVATLFSADAVLNPIESWAMDLDYQHGAKGLSVVRKALDGLLPGVKFKGIDKAKKKLEFTTPDGVLPLEQLSDGYQNVAAWCGDLLYRVTSTFEDYKNPFQARGLLLIDELDLHLHPVWKRQLVTYISDKQPNIQIIATTHSALTVHQAGMGELYVLRREAAGDPPTVFAYPGEPRTLLLHQLLLSPIFGLETVASVPVEVMRKEYKSLRAKPKATLAVGERKRLGELEKELQDLPDWSTETPQDKRQTALLADLQAALTKSGQGPRRSGSKARRRK
jgi:predicted ATPase